MSEKNLSKKFDEIESKTRSLSGLHLKTIAFIAFSWSLFQLWYASPFPFMVGFGVFIDVPARAIHLSFAFLIAFLSYPLLKKDKNKNFGILDIFIALMAFACAMYIVIFYEKIVYSNGILWKLPITLFGANYDFPIEMIIGIIAVILLLEATRRTIGLPLVIVAIVFLAYSVFGQSMPDLISHQGLSLKRLVGYHWFGGEAIFGIPISVSVSFVFLFVLFGSMLDYAGGGKYFLNLAIALVGKFRGGPAKASILASGLTGMISGSSIANVVTTGTFTIPVMKKTGFPAVKAGSIEVAASVNGQIMPPIMGAAAFIMAEMLGITYFQVITHAFIPAIIIYLSLFWISDLEASKLGLKGMEPVDIPPLRQTFLSGIHYLIPIGLLIYLLIIKRWSAGSSVFYSIIAMMALMIFQKIDFKSNTNFSDYALELNSKYNDLLFSIDTRLDQKNLSKKEMNYSLYIDKPFKLKLNYNETQARAFKSSSNETQSLDLVISNKINNHFKLGYSTSLDLKNNFNPYKSSVNLSLFDECSQLDITYSNTRFNDNFKTQPEEKINLNFKMDYLGFFGYEQTTDLFFNKPGDFNYGL